jgi:hypothetical protein
MTIQKSAGNTRNENCISSADKQEQYLGLAIVFIDIIANLLGD